MKELALLLPLLLLSIASGFSLTRNGPTGSNHQQRLTPLGAASNLGSVDSNSRRDALNSLLLLTSAGVVGALTSHHIPSAGKSRLSPEESLALIEEECDRRFLHAVVASGYQFMYRGMPTGDTTFPRIIQNEASGVVHSSGFASLEQDMASRPIKPSNARMAFTSPNLILEGIPASVWPLGNDVHFAWSEDGSPLVNSAGKMIVDGVDCGRMALEDALEGSDREILFRADQYLVVPISLEGELLARLKTAFII